MLARRAVVCLNNGWSRFVFTEVDDDAEAIIGKLYATRAEATNDYIGWVFTAALSGLRACGASGEASSL